MVYPYVTSAIAAAIVILVVYHILRKKWAALKADSKTEEQKTEDIERDAKRYGVGYDRLWDALYTLEGSCNGRGEYKGAFRDNLLDREAVYFFCRGKVWLVELLKGQYGLNLGAEVAFCQSDKISREFEELHYHSVPEEESLQMSYTLSLGSSVILKRSAKNWLLSGYLPGEYAGRQELELKTEITFPDRELRNSFLDALIRRGYPERDINLTENTVCFVFGIPRQINCCNYRKFITKLKDRQNKLRCARYRHLTEGYSRTVDKLSYIASYSPGLYAAVIKMGNKKHRGTDAAV